MIQLKKLRLYTHVTNAIRFPNKPGENYIVTYFSENSSLVEDYPKLNLRPVDVKITIIPITRIPRTRINPPLIKAFKKIGLRPYSSTIKVPSSKNAYYDLSQYLNALDFTYHPSNYRQRLSIFIKNIVNNSFSNFKNFEKVLMYSIDLTKPNINKFIDRKFFPILQQLKDESFDFEYLVLCLIKPSGASYRLLVKNGKFNLQKIITMLKAIRSGSGVTSDKEIEEEEEENDQVVDQVMKHIKDKIEPKNKENVKDAVKKYIKKDVVVKDKVIAKSVTPKNMEKIGVASILYKVNNDINKSKKITNSITKKSVTKVLKTIDKKYSDQILKTQKPLNTSNDNIVKSYDIPKVVSNKSPNHIFQKRLVDFEVNLQKDIGNSFNVLETKELPLKVGSIEITDKRQKNSEIEKSDVSLVKTFVTDKDGNDHKIQIEIPKIDPKSGTFRVNGQRKCLINQIVLCPITFPKMYESRFESSYSIFRIRSKRSRNNQYLEIFLGNTWLPLSVLLFYSFGFQNILDQYKIGYKISQEKPKKTDLYYVKIDSENYLYFIDVDNELKKQLVKSFTLLKIDSFNIKKDFGSNDYFSDMIFKITGKVNSTYQILSQLENIIDPVAKQVLINKQLPFTLKEIMYYMSLKVISGFVQDRNDILNQRIRGSEVIVHLLQKQILAAYTIYKQQLLSGNKNAKFEINQSKLLSEFNTSSIVANMEFANPIEEMAVMTRISPVGKNIGGIPDKRAIQVEARNIHPSYFGNIDPLDTPEGEMIGISQQLTIDSYITSARGMFSKKPFLNSEMSGMLSTSSSMIPFIENNDGARIIMATNQAKQMLPLKNPEPPIVRSGYESLLTNVLSNNFIKKSPCYGKIINITFDNITIIDKTKKLHNIDITPIHLKSGTGKDTLSIFKVIVKLNQIVHENQIIAEGSSISKGAISLGRTLCTAVMPYEGFNFEDGIVINEKLISGDKLTSIHGIVDEVLVSENDRVLEIAKIGQYIEKGSPVLRKTIGEIEQLLGFSEEEGEEVIGQQFIKKSPGGKVVDIDIFSNIGDTKFPILKELIQRTRTRYKTTPSEKFSVKGKTIQGVLIRFKIEQELKINLGDKLCNRYGAKGIICLIEKNENMPRTPWGEYVDIIVNPVGIIARSNIGQLYELYCGLIARDLGMKIVTLKKKEKILSYIQKIYSILDTSKNKQFTTRLIANLSALSEKEFLNLVEQIKTTGFVPIIIPPFQAPKQDQIKEALKILGLKPGYNLFLPKYGIKTKTEVPIGYMYFSSLEHKAADKVYGRSTGPVVSKTLQPTSGKQKEGGQRLGEADTYSLISYNCPKLISELMGPLSDDLTTKNEMISEIIETGTTTYRNAKISPAKDLLNSYFISLILERT